jgi:hypothetical protein
MNATGTAVPVSAASLKGCLVQDSAGEAVGRLLDLVVRWDTGEYPRLTGIVVRIGARRSFVHAATIGEATASAVRLLTTAFDLHDYVRRPGEWLVRGDLLDHQLLDVDGVRVVRASDLYFERDEGGWELVGVDVSFLAFLRRLLPRPLRRSAVPERVLAWSAVQPLGRPGDPIRLRQHHRGLRQLRAADFARLLEDLAWPERQSLIGSLERGHAAEVLEEMDPHKVTDVLRRVPASTAAELLALMAPDEAADALRDLPELERRAILALVRDPVAATLARLSGYAPNEAGGLMTTTLAFISPHDTIAQARAVAVQHRRDLDVQGLVVVDEQGRLIDDLPLSEVIASDPATTVESVIAPPRPGTVLASDGLATVVRELTANRGASLIVVDESHRPLGRILADDVVDALAGSRRERRWPWQPRPRREPR